MKGAFRLAAWRTAKKIGVVTLAGGSAGILICETAKRNDSLAEIKRQYGIFPTINASSSEYQEKKKHAAEYPPEATWDFNWDKRDPAALVKPLREGATDEEVALYKEKLKLNTPTAKRILILVRHGQYNMMGTKDSERYLTELGREQADLTGKRLAELVRSYEDKGKVKRIITILTMSTMTRASQTAEIILNHFPSINSKSCDLIREGAPCEPVPNVIAGIWDPEPHLFYQEGARIEAGFRKYFHRADPEQKEDSIEILVCHGNVIRYFVCRALQLPPQAWLRFAVHNGSFTIATIQPTGRISVSAFGESGHLPVNKLTFN